MDFSTTITSPTQNSTAASVARHYYPVEVRTIMGTIAALSFLCNGGLCCVVFRNTAMLQKAHNVLVFTLAVTDMLTGLFTLLSPRMVLGFDDFYATTGIAGDLYCRLIHSSNNIWVFAKFSIGLVTCMAVERWYALARPHEYKFVFKRSRVICYILVMAAISIVAHITGFVQKITPEKGCVSVPLFPGQLAFQLRTIILVTVTFIIPLGIITFTFLHLRLIIKSGATAISSTIRNLEIRLARMTGTVALVLGICFLPNQLYFLLFTFGVADVRSPWFLFTMVLSSLNSTVNPFIYCITNPDYRKKFKHLFCPCKENQVLGEEMQAPEIAAG